MADVFWGTYPIVLTAPAKIGALDVVVIEQDMDITTLIAPDKSVIGDAVEFVIPSAIAAGFFYNGAAFTDYTIEANEATANDVFLLHDSSDFFYVGEDANFDWIAFNIGTAGTGSGSFGIEYSTVGGWVTLPSDNYASTLNNFKTAGYVDIFIFAPDDWDDQTVNGETRRWIRFNGGGIYTIDPLATQIWTNTVSTNRFLTSSDTLAIDDTDATSWVTAFGKNVLDTLVINEWTDGFYFSIDIGAGGGFLDTLVITDAMGVPHFLVVSDNITFADIISTLNGPRLVITDTFIVSDIIAFSELAGPVESQIVPALLGTYAYGVEWMGYIAIGTGTTAVDELRDDSLEAEVHRKKAKVWSVGNTYFVDATFSQDEPTGDDIEITEIGIFDAEVAGNMARRWVLDTAVEKDNIDELPIECRIVFLQGTILDFDNTLDEEMGISDSISLVIS